MGGGPSRPKYMGEILDGVRHGQVPPPVARRLPAHFAAGGPAAEGIGTKLPYGAFAGSFSARVSVAARPVDGPPSEHLSVRLP